MKIKQKRLRGQTVRAKKLWLEWWTKLQSDDSLTVSQLASQYTNKYTGKKYTRASIYNGIKRLEELTT